MTAKLRGRVRINASGRNLTRFINRLHTDRIACFGQYCKKDIFRGTIYSRDLADVRKIADELEISLRYAEYRTAASIFSAYRKRIGFFIGIIAVLICTVYLSEVVVTIEINGNSTISEDVILAALSELDVKRGTFIRSIDFHRCENELRLRIDGLLAASMRRTGNRLVVDIREIVPKPEMLNERVPCDIVSCKDAVITSVTVWDGMLMHIIGNHVTEGTTLISGTVKNTSEQISLHHAQGCINGIYVDSAVFRCEYRPKRYAPTGITDTQRSIKLFSLDIPLYFGKNDFEEYDMQTEECPLTLFGKQLPISLITRKITEKKLSEIQYSEEEAEKILMEKIYLYENNFLTDVRIISRKIDVHRTETELAYNVSYCLEGNIGTQKEIFTQKSGGKNPTAD